jgi:hypothetical protein
MRKDVKDGLESDEINCHTLHRDPLIRKKCKDRARRRAHYVNSNRRYKKV